MDTEDEGDITDRLDMKGVKLSVLEQCYGNLSIFENERDVREQMICLTSF